MNRQQIIAILKDNKNLLNSYGVRKLYLFGSSARNEANEASYIDVIVEFDPQARIGLFQLSRLRYELSQILHSNVDLTTMDALHQDLRTDTLHEAVHAA